MNYRFSLVASLLGLLLLISCSDKKEEQKAEPLPVQLDVDTFVKNHCGPAPGGSEDAVIIRTKSGERAMQCKTETTSVILTGKLKTAGATCTKMACQRDTPCCNTCNATAVLTGREYQIALQGIGCENHKVENPCTYQCGKYNIGATYSVTGELSMPAYDYLAIAAPMLSILDAKPADDINPRCKQPPAGEGKCEGLWPVFYFNPEADDCEKGSVSGCSASSPFKSLKECRKTCDIPEPEAAPPPPPRETRGVDILDKVTPKEPDEKITR